jgi:hypothetical protein
MSKSDTFENQLLQLIFNGTAIPNLAQNDTLSPLTNLFVALHTADPGEAGNQSTSEVSYTGYARVGVARTTGGWVVTGNSVSPANNIEFGEMTAGTAGTATHASIGTAASGGGTILYRGALTPSVAFNVGVIPRIRNTSTITED